MHGLSRNYIYQKIPSLLIENSVNDEHGWCYNDEGLEIIL